MTRRAHEELAPAAGDPQIWVRMVLGDLYARRSQQDTKANLLLSLNAIMLSLAAGGAYPAWAETPHLRWALVPLALTNLVSMGLAVIAVRPRLQGDGRIDLDAIAAGRGRLATFDDFHDSDAETFARAVSLILGRRDLMYGTLTQEIFTVGRDLHRRFRALRLAYLVFGFGVALSVAAFVACHLIGTGVV